MCVCMSESVCACAFVCVRERAKGTVCGHGQKKHTFQSVENGCGIIAGAEAFSS